MEMIERHYFRGRVIQDFSFKFGFVIPNSTFAWWSAWLANYPDKKIVAPRIWADKSEPDAGEIVPTSWMRI